MRPFLLTFRLPGVEDGHASLPSAACGSAGDPHQSARASCCTGQWPAGPGTVISHEPVIGADRLPVPITGPPWWGTGAWRSFLRLAPAGLGQRPGRQAEFRPGHAIQASPLQPGSLVRQAWRGTTGVRHTGYCLHG